jgi:hypothetical protein
VPTRPDQVGAGPLRLAVLDADLGQFRSALCGDHDVDDQPGLVEAQILQCDADPAAHHARRTVTGDHVRRANCMGAAVGCADLQRHALGILRQVGHRVPQRHLHLRQAGHMGAQYLFRGRLVEHQRGRERQRKRWLDGAEALDQLAVDAVELGRRERLGMLQDLRVDAQLLEHPHDFMVQCEGARLVVDFGGLVADPGPDALCA